MSYGEIIGDKSDTYVHWGDLILRVNDYIVTISFGMCLVLWLF